MKPFREQVKEMKLWMIPFAIGVCMLAFSVVFIVVLRAYLSFGKLPPVSGRHRDNPCQSYCRRRAYGAERAGYRQKKKMLRMRQGAENKGF